MTTRRQTFHYQHNESAVSEADPINELAQQLEPVARLFGDHYLNQQRYRSHSVEDVRASTKADVLIPSLTDL